MARFLTGPYAEGCAEAEECVVGACLLKPAMVVEAKRILEPKMFAGEAAAKVFESLLSLDERHVSIDPLSLRDELIARGCFEDVGGNPYIVAIQETLPEVANLGYYALQVRKHFYHREQYGVAAKLAEVLGDAQRYEDVADFSERAAAKLSELVADRSAIDREPAHAVMQAARGQSARRLPSPFQEIAANEMGFFRGSLGIIGARRGEFKTTYALLQIAEVCRARGRALIYAPETAAGRFGERMGSQLLRKRWADADDAEKDRVAREIESWYFERLSRRMTPLQVASEIRPRARADGLDLAVIDYLQRFPEAREPRQLDRAVHLFEDLAGECQIAVVCCSQLNRPDRTDKSKHRGRPYADSAQGSATIEQTAQVIHLLWWPKLYDHQTVQVHGRDYSAEKTVELIVAKNSDGPDGRVPLRVDPACYLLTDDWELEG